MIEPKKIQLNTVFLGIIASLMLAGVPWTYSINGRLTVIETQLTRLLQDKDEITQLERRVNICETNIAVLQNEGNRP